MALYRTLPDPTFQTHKSRVGSGYEISKQCVRVRSASAERVVDLSKHYIHVIDALVSLDRAEYFALEKHAKTVT